jgi:hypothetical protein
MYLKSKKDVPEARKIHLDVPEALKDETKHQKMYRKHWKVNLKLQDVQYLKHLKLYSMNPAWPKFSSRKMQTRARTLFT